MNAIYKIQMYSLICICVYAAAVAAVSLQSCPTLCDPIDGSPPGSPVPGILQARTLQRVAISFSNAGKWKVKMKSLSRVRLFETPWTAAHQAPPSMGFSRQEYWSGVPLPPLSVWINIYCAYAAISRRNRRMLVNVFIKFRCIFTCWKWYCITLLKINICS